MLSTLISPGFAGRGMLEPGRISTLTWSIGGERTGEISLAAQANVVRLLTGRDGAKTSINEFVPFAYTVTMFGGSRRLRGSAYPF